MSTCGEILSNILVVIPNPEREALIRVKMNQMIHFISSSGLFWRDIAEVVIDINDGVDNSSNLQSIPITTAIRSLVYCKYPSTVVGSIECVNLESLIQNCDILGDVAYLSGDILHIKNSILVDSFNLAYYTNPVAFAVDGTDDDSSNWITELVPGLVEDLTVAYMLNLIGEKEDSKRITELAYLFKATYVRDFVQSIN